MARLTLADIAHSYLANPQGPEDWALKSMHHVWEDGGAYALLGPSGCGKTTLLNILSGLLIPSRGQVLFDQTDVTELPTEERNIAQVFQFPVVYDTMTVRQNLAFPLENRRVDRATIAKRVEDIAHILDLTRDLDRLARRLTADSKQKISLGRGLVREDVNAILFDEPLTVIDPQLKWELRSQLKKLHHEFDFTMIYVTHDQTEALTFADRVVVMYEGEVVQMGTPEQLFERPEHTFVGYFIGSPGMNIAPAEIQGAWARVAGHNIRLGRAYPDLPANARIELGVRPEFVHLADPGDEEAVPARVRRVDDVGRVKVIRCEFGDLPVSVIASEDAEISDDQVRLGFDRGRLHVYADGHIVEGEAA